MRYIVGVGLWLLLSLSATSAAQFSGVNDFTKSLSIELSKQVSFPDGIKSMVVHFCKTIMPMTSVLDYGDANSAYMFDPKQSMFLYVLCSDLWVGGSVLADETRYDSIKLRTWEQYGITTQDKYETEWICAPWGGLQFCNIPQQFFSVYNKIMSTYVDMFQAQIYAANMPWDSTKAKAEAFTDKYLVGLKLCPDGNCVYPTSQKRLEKYIKNGENLWSSVDVINTKKFSEKLKTDAVTSACKNQPGTSNPSVNTSSYSVLYCAFAPNQSNPYKSFLNLVMQEHFFYRLFLTYYDYVIQTDHTVLPDQYREVSARNAKKLAISQSMQNYISWSKQALWMSLTMVQELRVTFPLHIGLLIYYEDLYRLRKELLKMVTPLYTLYDKLRNVQKADQ